MPYQSDAMRSAHTKSSAASLLVASSVLSPSSPSPASSLSGSGTTYFGLSASFSNNVAVGRHYLAWLERGRTGSTSVFWGDGGFNINSGMYGEVSG